jgi:hypothetical protein
MKLFKILFVLPAILIATELEFEMKDGTIEIGEPICQSKGKVTIKVGSSTVTAYKKSLKRVGDLDVNGAREYMIDDSLFLIEKNEIQFINTSGDSCVVKFRRGDHSIVAEKSISENGSVYFDIGDGSYYETVQYFRGETIYYSKGLPFLVESKCDSFEKYDITLRGYPNTTPPILKSTKNSFERE